MSLPLRESMRALVVACAVVRASVALRAVGRRRFVGLATASAPAAAAAASYQTGTQFEGGAGGLSKKKPDRGVRVSARAGAAAPAAVPPGRVVARLLGPSGGAPADVAYDSPWPTTAGLVSRDYATGDGAYVLAVATRGGGALEADVRAKLFAADGKYGAYGPVADSVETNH